MPTACTLIATAIPNPEHLADMQAYIQGAGALFEPLGGGEPRRMKVGQVVAGDAAVIVLVQDFPDRDELSALFASDAYQALIPARSRGFKTINIWIA